MKKQRIKNLKTYLITFLLVLVTFFMCVLLISHIRKFERTYYLVSMRGMYDNAYYDITPGVNYYSIDLGYGGEFNDSNEVLFPKDFVTVDFGDKFYTINIGWEEVFVGSYTIEKNKIKAQVGNEEKIWIVRGNKIEIEIGGLNIVVSAKKGLYDLFYG